MSSLELQLTLDEPLTPELALVCPELAEQARRLLPDPGWCAPIRRPDPVRVTRLQAFVLAFASIFLTVTPLVLALLAARSRAPHH